MHGSLPISVRGNRTARPRKGKHLVRPRHGFKEGGFYEDLEASMAKAVFDEQCVCKGIPPKLRARSLSSRAPYGSGDIRMDISASIILARFAERNTFMQKNLHSPSTGSHRIFNLSTHWVLFMLIIPGNSTPQPGNVEHFFRNIEGGY